MRCALPVASVEPRLVQVGRLTAEAPDQPGEELQRGRGEDGQLGGPGLDRARQHLQLCRSQYRTGYRVTESPHLLLQLHICCDCPATCLTAPVLVIPPDQTDNIPPCKPLGRPRQALYSYYFITRSRLYRKFHSQTSSVSSSITIFRETVHCSFSTSWQD